MDRANEATGFKSACAEFSERSLSLDEKLLLGSPAVFIIEASTESRILDIKIGDKLVVDRSLHPVTGKIIVLVRDNQMEITKFHPKLIEGHDPETGDFVWGVVTAQIREHR